MDEETTLKNARKTIKGNVTRILNFVNELESDDSEQMIIRDAKLDDLWSKYDEIQSNLEVINQEYESDRDIFEKSYYSAKTAIFKRLNPNLRKQISPSSARQTTNAPEPERVKLPQINIPNFDGNYQDWTSFHDIFDSLIHKNQSLSKIQKFYYLKSQLKGEALSIIEAITVSAENYDEAWTLLVERYDNKQHMVGVHVRALFDMPTVGKNSLSGLRTLIAQTKQHLRSLKCLGRPTDCWDDLIIFMILQKVDYQCQREWELNKGTDAQEMPNLKDLFSFLEKRCFSLEAMSVAIQDKQNRAKPHYAHVSSNNKYQAFCKLCKGEHTLSKCEKFLKQTPDERTLTAKQLNACFNCLGSHGVKSCNSSFTCRTCHKKHHTLIHIEKNKQADRKDTNNTQDEKKSFTLQNMQQSSEVLLSTALIEVRDARGRWQSCRALLDSASQTHFMTKELLNRLGIQSSIANIPIGGIGQSKTNVKKTAFVKIRSRIDTYTNELECLILEQITDRLPNVTINTNTLNLPENIVLADPTFHIPGQIDILLGAEIFMSTLKPQKFKLNDPYLNMQDSHFGFIISGKVQQSYSANIQSFLSTNSLQTQMQKFWEIEEKFGKTILSQEEEACEQHFQENTKRDENGRFVVRLPFKGTPMELGDSFTIASKRLAALQRRFKMDDSYRKQYQEFIDEYKTMGHMTEVKNNDPSEGYYMPHHAVLKGDSLTTKIRVVFDASAATSSGVSLNNLLMVGPTLQDDITAILMRFRTHRYVLIADVAKMYRQVRIHPDDAKYQKILWRSNENEEITYQLETVTYGTASAPYLATKCLQQLAKEEEKEFTLASEVLRRDFYVDDVLTGSNTFEETLKLRQQLAELLKRGGFILRKWSSNEPRLLENLSATSDDSLIQLDMNQTVKTLGLQWKASDDVILYHVTDYDKEHMTKRIILSQIARLFDPLGLLGPIICKAKIIMQEIWRSNLDWDDEVPEEIAKQWRIFKSQLPKLNELKLPRQVLMDEPQEIQLHGFADASESAYGACLFLRSTSNGVHCVRLLTAKSRVAPLKKLSLPRLELCAAVLLANLVTAVCKSLNVKIDKTFLWSDSTITLAWIKTPPFKLKTFVANRVSEIQQLTANIEWRWVSTKDNPADVISRGCLPEHIMKDDEIWFTGPEWLRRTESKWPLNNEREEIPEEILELKPATATCLTTVRTFRLFERISKFTKLERCMAYCLRFIQNCRNSESRSQGILTVSELDKARTSLIKLTQFECFSNDIELLAQGGNVSAGKLKSLNPFIDQDGLLRVGGRLQNANIEYNEKHQIILPAEHTFTRLFIKHEHIRTMHSGTQNLLNHIRQAYWPTNGRSTVKKIIHLCKKCFRFRAAKLENNQMMGNLPACRFQTVRPFLNVGIDYGGPLYIRASNLKRAPTLKAYIALFICMTTKCIHLELVSSLSTPEFLASFKRFIARRGKPNNVYSDNGTNFQGACAEMRRLHEFLATKTNQTEISEQASIESVQWHFIPPNAPQFGGLWEAGIKQVKFLIRRVIGEARLTFEEMNTLLIQVEGIINSRPLTPINDDSTDPIALTPAHFLIGTPLTQIAEPIILNEKVNRLTRWQMVQQMFQHIWKRWHHEYLNHLQQRSKWQGKIPNLKINDIVIIKEDNTPPLRWTMGRIQEVFPGADGRVRVVLVKTNSGVFKRPSSKLVLLPLE